MKMSSIGLIQASQYFCDDFVSRNSIAFALVCALLLMSRLKTKSCVSYGSLFRVRLVFGNVKFNLSSGIICCFHEVI